MPDASHKAVAVGPQSEFSRRISNALAHNHGVAPRPFAVVDVIEDIFERRGLSAICHVLSYRVATLGVAANYEYSGHAINSGTNKDIISLVLRSVINMALAANFLNIPLIHISDDSVFGGKMLGYDDWTEDTEPYPIDWSGQLHVWAEQLVRSICPEAIIIRLSALYGFQEDRVRDRVSRPLFVGTAASAIADITNRASEKQDALPSMIHVTNDSDPSSYHDIGFNASLKRSRSRLTGRPSARDILAGEPRSPGRGYAGLTATPGFFTVPLEMDLERERVEIHNTKVWGSWKAVPQPVTFPRTPVKGWEHAPDEWPF